MIIVMLGLLAGFDPPVTVVGKVLTGLIAIAAVLTFILIHQTLKES
jgi:hypothetical protein